MEFWQQIGQVGGALGGILLLILALAFVARRMQQGPAPQGKQLAIVDTLHLGTKERLLLVQVGEQRLLLGVTANQISHLSHLDRMASETVAGNVQADLFRPTQLASTEATS